MNLKEQPIDPREIQLEIIRLHREVEENLKEAEDKLLNFFTFGLYGLIKEWWWEIIEDMKERIDAGGVLWTQNIE